MNRKPKKRKYQHHCTNCGTTVDVTYDSDPYNSDINGDYTKVWLCGGCRQDRADEI